MKIVILCGGKGTRSYPFTEYYPKAMMPIAGKPILVHLMRTFADQGFTEFVLAAGHRQEMLHDYFSGRFHEWDVQIVDTGAESGTGERLRRSLPHVGDSFIATYGDGLGDVDLGALTEFHRSSGGLATVTSVQLRCQYGTVVLGDKSRVTQFVEKPIIESCWINAGYFVLQREAIAGSEGQNLETDILPRIAARGGLFSYQHTGFWKSMDSSKDQQEFEELYHNAAGAVPWKLSRAMTAIAS